MKSISCCSMLGVAALSAVLASALIVPRAEGRVFASNVRLNGTNANLTIAAGGSVTIGYLLNQDASSVTAAIVSGTNVFWTTNLINAGTNQGLNTVVWPGTSAGGAVITNGLYQVEIRASAAGRTNWWKVPVKTSSIALEGDGYAYAPYGIAVNNNAASPFFGRIFVGNAYESGGADPGDYLGIAKYNADGSYADEGAYSSGGWDWSPDNFPEDESPGKLEVDANDRLYVMDRLYQATVLNFDQLVSTNSPPTFALNNDDLFSASPTEFSGPCVTGAGTNRALLMSDLHNGAPGGLGIRRWNLGGNGVAGTNDYGTTIVAAGSGLDLDFFPQDVSMDAVGRLYVIQKLPPFALSSAHILRYPPYAGTTLTNADLKVFPDDTNKLGSASAIAVARHTNWIAVVCSVDNGKPITVHEISGTNAILLTQDGDGLNNLLEGGHEYTDVTWDLAGNLYVTDPAYGIWRLLSPPGANSFATTSLQSVKVGPYRQPQFVGAAWKTNVFQFQLAAEIGVTYAIETSSNLGSWTAVATNTAKQWTNAWSVSLSAPRSFVRARALPLN